MIIGCDSNEKLNQGVEQIVDEVVEILQRDPQTVCLCRIRMQAPEAIENGVGNRMGHPKLHSVSNEEQVVFWFEK